MGTTIPKTKLQNLIFIFTYVQKQDDLSFYVGRLQFEKILIYTIFIKMNEKVYSTCFENYIVVGKSFTLLFF